MKKTLAVLAATTALVFAGGAIAQTMDKNVKIGSLGDQASLYADIGGAGALFLGRHEIVVIGGKHHRRIDFGCHGVSGHHVG